jgi:putative ABC transport system permease protein
LTKKLDVAKDLRKRAKDADLDKRSAESKLGESERRCEKLSEELALLKLSGAAEKLECVVSASQLFQVLTESTARTSQLQAKLEGHVATIAVLQHKLEETAKKADAAEQELATAKANLQETQAQLDNTMKEVYGARIAHEQAAKQIELFQAEKATYKAQFEDEKRAEMAELERNAIAFRQKETQKLQSLISALEKQKDTLEKKLKDEVVRQEGDDMAYLASDANINNKASHMTWISSCALADEFRE